MIREVNSVEICPWSTARNHRMGLFTTHALGVRGTVFGESIPRPLEGLAWGRKNNVWESVGFTGVSHRGEPGRGNWQPRLIQCQSWECLQRLDLPMLGGRKPRSRGGSSRPKAPQAVEAELGPLDAITCIIHSTPQTKRAGCWAFSDSKIRITAGGFL